MHNDVRQRPATPLAWPDPVAAKPAERSGADTPPSGPGTLGDRKAAVGTAGALSRPDRAEAPGPVRTSPLHKPVQVLDELAQQELDRLRRQKLRAESKTEAADRKHSHDPQQRLPTFVAPGLVAGSLQRVAGFDGQPVWQARFRFDAKTEESVLFHSMEDAAVPAAQLQESGIEWPEGGLRRHEVAAWKLCELLGLKVVARAQFAQVDKDAGWVQCLPAGVSPLTCGRLRMPLPAALVETLNADPRAARELFDRQGFSQVRLADDTLVLQGRTAPPEAPDKDLPPGAILVPMDFTDPVLRREVNTLHWFDCLIGYYWRGADGYVVSFDTAGRVRAVTARRNGLGFGRGKYSADMHHRSKPPMPHLIDRAVARAFLEVDARAIRGALDKLLDADPLDDLLDRLKAIHARVTTLSERHQRGQAACLLKGDAQWASSGTGLLLGVPEQDADLKDLGKFKALSEDQRMPEAGPRRKELVQKQLAVQRRQAAFVSYLAREAVTQAQALWWMAGPMRDSIPPSVPAVADLRQLALALGVRLDGKGQ